MYVLLCVPVCALLRESLDVCVYTSVSAYLHKVQVCSVHFGVENLDSNIASEKATPSDKHRGTDQQT